MSQPAPEPPRPDTLVAPLLYALSDCLCAELATTTGGGVCWCGVLPGLDVVADCGCGAEACGSAWVRLVSLFPSAQFPNIDRSGRPCQSALAATIELGVVRCMPVVDDDGSVPSVNDQLAAVQDQMSDMAAMLRVLCNCPALAGKKTVLGAYQPNGPAGGCGGGLWTVTVAL